MTDALLIGGPNHQARMPLPSEAEADIVLIENGIEERYRYLRSSVTLLGSPLQIFVHDSISSELAESLLPATVVSTENTRIRGRLNQLAA